MNRESLTVTVVNYDDSIGRRKKKGNDIVAERRKDQQGLFNSATCRIETRCARIRQGNVHFVFLDIVIIRFLRLSYTKWLIIPPNRNT